MSLNELFASISSTDIASSIDVGGFVISILASLILGAVIAAAYAYKSKHSKTFVMTLVIMPAVVAMVIMMVNGSIGTGIAVAGAFSLVRFRSVPGSAKEIGAIFMAMGTGLATGMGYIAFAALFVAILSIVNVALNLSPIGEQKVSERTLTITIPEDLDYEGVFDDLFEEYTTSHVLNRVKTTNMGSMFKLTYDIDIKTNVSEKAFIDEIRCRNGNLEITMSKQAKYSNEL